MTPLNRLIDRLCDGDIDFVIVGGFAGMLAARQAGAIGGLSSAIARQFKKRRRE